VGGDSMRARESYQSALYHVVPGKLLQTVHRVLECERLALLTAAVFGHVGEGEAGGVGNRKARLLIREPKISGEWTPSKVGLNPCSLCSPCARLPRVLR
jgi:hypothetical protein